MKIFCKISIVTVFIVSLVLGLTGLITTLAATDPGLGAAASFSVLAQTQITGISTISGDVGMNSTGTGITALTTANVAGTIYATDLVAPSEGIILPAVQADVLAAYTTNIPGQALTSNQGPALDGLVLTPGVYDIGAGRLNGGVLTLNGAGVYIFRASSDFISSGSVLLTNGARACDVFWRVQTLATINGNSFVGTILAGTGVHFGANVTLDGRALAIGGDVTMITDTISGPTCAAAAVPESGGSIIRRTGTITVVKMVINDNGGTKTVNDFPLFVNNTLVASMVTNTFPAPAGVYSVTETVDSNYTRTFSGDCDINGQLNLDTNENKFCIITNDDIGVPVIVPPVPPIIAVVKVPSPLALPAGPGSVTYTYTLRNIGTVPVTNVTMVGDTCSPITLVFGDINADAKLDVNETWTYRCSTTLSETHTNTVVATGWANGLTATDIASATVVVGVPTVPPLIHVTKVPSPLTLLAGGGMVTYTKRVTNPGTVALSNVRLTDDKCDSVKYISGDTNSDSKLDTTETWTYTCQTNLTKTTTNTVTASGEANGLAARDFAIATVVVVPGQVLGATTPGLPNTGLPPEGRSISWSIVILAGIFTASILFYFIRRKQTA